MSMYFSNHCVSDGTDVEHILMVELMSQFTIIYLYFG